MKRPPDWGDQEDGCSRELYSSRSGRTARGELLHAVGPEINAAGMRMDIR